MEAFVTAGAGFLLAVLWFDLMHDVLVRGHDGELPSDDLDTIARYYRRVTTDAHPMGRLVLVAMLATFAASIAQIAADPGPVGFVSAALVLAAMVLVRVRTFPFAVRIGMGRESTAARSDLARAVYRDHVACFIGMAAIIAMQLVAAAS